MDFSGLPALEDDTTQHVFSGARLCNTYQATVYRGKWRTADGNRKLTV